jgi:ATP-binding protein involved in chromosome partitioning
MAEEMGVPYLGAIPIELEVVESGDDGVPIVVSSPRSEAARAIARIAHTLLERP